MNDEELIKETMMLDYSQLVMHNVYMIKENKRLHSIIKEVREKLNTQLAFTSSYQLNYQSAMSIIEDAKSILRGVDKN